MTDFQDTPQQQRDIDGYTIEMRYHYRYLSYLAPAWLRLAVTDCGIAFPENRPLRYLELGYGTGVALNIHAAADPGEYWGTDANPEHAAYANRLAAASGVDLRALDLPFSQLVDYPNLPQFDIITAPGIWSWISQENRVAVVEILQKHLAPGGIFFLTYNAMPGMAAVVPLQQLLRLHGDLASPSADAYQQWNAAMRFASRLGQCDDGGYFSGTPFARRTLKDIESTNPLYNIHEYMGRNWHPCFFSDVARALEPAGLRYVGSARLIEHAADESFSQPAKDLLQEIDDPILRETTRDFLLNKTFRSDIFAKGIVRLDPQTRRDKLAAQSFALVQPAEEIDLTVPIELSGPALALAKSRRAHARSVLSIFADVTCPLCAKEIASTMGSAANIDDIIRALLDLCCLRMLKPVTTSVSTGARQACQKLNQFVAQEWREGRGIYALASPTVGAGVHVSTWHHAFEAAYEEGACTIPGLLERAKPLLTAHADMNAPETGRDAVDAVKALRAADLFLKSGEIWKRLGLRN
ncbi:MAG: class I SAM-dependent methyltransferase [Hyphomicrobiaceae bacterium]|nr:class I SAM-dependent methyltransferase [Hyphomicrobiaceae bacterium]